MFDKLFSRFKKEKDAADYANMTVRDLEVGCILDYDLSTFVVKEAYEYDWGDNFFSKEYKISDGTKTLFLSIEEDDEMEIEVSEKVKIRRILDYLPEHLKENGKPPKSIVYNDVRYYFDEESPGFFRNCKDERESDESWTEFISWSCYDDSEKQILTLERWGEDDFEASVGKVIKEFQISNLLPKPSN